MGFYNQVEARVPNKSGFRRSYKNRLSMQFDYIYPTMVDETLPGDHFKLNQKNLIRFAPMLAPAFADSKLYSHYYYVPRRIVEPCWKQFITGDPNVASLRYSKSLQFRPYNIAQIDYQTSAGYVYSIPRVAERSTQSVDGSCFASKSLFEYMTSMSIPAGDAIPNQTIDLAAFMAYQYIYNEYYRDSQIDADIFNVPYQGLWWLTSIGYPEYVKRCEAAANALSNYSSYQKPDGTFEVVNLISELDAGIVPLTSVNWVQYKFHSSQDVRSFAVLNLEILAQLFKLRRRRWYKDYFTCARTHVTDNEVPIVPVQFNDLLDSASGGNVQSRDLVKGDLYVASTSNPAANANVLTADNGTRNNNGQYLFTKLGFTISALRLANALQKFGEKSVKFGLRYLEQIASHYGVIVSDETAQIPQYCGGSQSECYVNEVTQTSQSTDDSAQGNYSGHMMTSGNGDFSEIYCEEHGYVFILTSCVAESSYTDMLSRMWQRSSDRLNFYFPEFANLSDQEVKQKELYPLKASDLYNGADDTNDTLFGYQGRYDEYRVRVNEYHGEFKNSLDFWHLGRKFLHPSDLPWSVSVCTHDQTDIPLTGCIFNADENLNHFFYNGDKDPDVSVNYLIWQVGNKFESPTLLDSSNYTTILNSGIQSIGSWLWAIGQYNIFVGTIPAQWILTNKNTYSSEYYDFARGGYLLATFPEDFSLPYDISALIPKLTSQFIASDVSPRIFAKTKDLDNLRINHESDILGDDYMMCTFYNDVSVVRCMPMYSEPKL